MPTAPLDIFAPPPSVKGDRLVGVNEQSTVGIFDQRAIFHLREGAPFFNVKQNSRGEISSGEKEQTVSLTFLRPPDDGRKRSVLTLPCSKADVDAVDKWVCVAAPNPAQPPPPPCSGHLGQPHHHRG